MKSTLSDLLACKPANHWSKVSAISKEKPVGAANHCRTELGRGNAANMLGLYKHAQANGLQVSDQVPARPSIQQRILYLYRRQGPHRYIALYSIVSLQLASGIGLFEHINT